MQNPSFRPFGDPTLTQLFCFSQKIKSVSIKKEVHGTYRIRVRVNKPCTAPEEATASQKRRRAK